MAWPELPKKCTINVENRKLNLIFYNVPETKTRDISARKVYDTNFASDIANKIQAGKVDVTSVSQLGKKVDNKNRLLKVQVTNLSQKRNLLLNAKMHKWHQLKVPVINLFPVYIHICIVHIYV